MNTFFDSLDFTGSRKRSESSARQTANAISSKDFDPKWIVEAQEFDSFLNKLEQGKSSSTESREISRGLEDSTKIKPVDDRSVTSYIATLPEREADKFKNFARSFSHSKQRIIQLTS